MKNEFQKIPNQVQDLIRMATEYLRQETIEPAKRLGKHAGLGIGGALLFSFGAFLAILGVYSLLRMVLPDSEWYIVLARFLAGIVAAAGAGIVAWRIGAE